MACLTENREDAGKIYAKLHEKLELFFGVKGLSEPDVAADLTLERLGQVLYSKSEPVGDIEKFAFGIAKKIFFEQQRNEIKQRLAFDKIKTAAKAKAENSDFRDLAENCISKLDADEQQMLFDYFVDLPFSECVVHREKLAESLNVNLNHLRQKISVIKRKLEKIIETERKSENEKARKAKKNIFRRIFS
ncbi:MAG: hypothetical protein H7Z37_14120 [Pyrinomonadaceae bacterium]|nr:hypothetical protein [Pyrinomonadaceae bacterium]